MKTTTKITWVVGLVCALVGVAAAQAWTEIATIRDYRQKVAAVRDLLSQSRLLEAERELDSYGASRRSHPIYWARGEALRAEFYYKKAADRALEPHKQNEFFTIAKNCMTEALEVEDVEEAFDPEERFANTVLLASASAAIGQYSPYKEIYVRDAVSALEDILENVPASRDTVQESRALNSLGNSYAFLAEVTDEEPEELLYGEAVETLTKAAAMVRDYPAEYAKAQTNLGEAYTELAVASGQSEYYPHAFAAFAEAIKTTEDRVETEEPIEWRLPVKALATMNRAETWIEYGTVTGELSALAQAQTDLMSARTLVTDEAYAVARINYLEGRAARAHARFVSTAEQRRLLEQSRQSLYEATQGVSFKHGQAYGEFHEALADTLVQLAALTDNRETLLRNAISSYENAARTFTREGFPRQERKVREKLRIATEEMYSHQ